jgi:hypothetical protein
MHHFFGAFILVPGYAGRAYGNPFGGKFMEISYMMETGPWKNNRYSGPPTLI